jgi:hypothetical protein
LLERGFITRESVVNGCVEITETTRRNRNFKVKEQKGPGYFVKQVRRFDPEAQRTLRAEAECYRLAAQDERFAALARVVPHFHTYDPRRSVLITALLDGAETLTEHHLRTASFPVDVAEQLGRTFGDCHCKAITGPPSDLDGIFLRRTAWALSLHEMPPAAAPDLSGGIHQMLGMVRQFPQFEAALNKLRAEWRFDALIHGDIKWENCVLCPGADGRASLKIVDWEMVDWGDSCWDVAGIFSSYLSFWVASLPPYDSPDAGLLVGQARFPIERMQPALRSFWSTYVRCRDISGQPARDFLRQAVLYAGARNIQTAFELLQLSPQANRNTVLLLQLSMNILLDPDQATSELLGIA